ncbi:hypothetical protein SRHO_G00099980 [Serrasalmus rhombeus]
MSQSLQAYRNQLKVTGCWYNATLNDTEQIEQLRQDTISGLKQINNTGLPGKLKLWCFQFGLLPCLMWPITIYEVTSSHISRLERLVNAQVRRWLVLPRCMSSVGLYVDGPLSLPISSLTEEYKCAKARLEMTLSESRDPLVRCAAPALRTEVQTSTAFIREGERQPTRAPPTISSLIGTARDWQLRVDLDKSLVFPPNIAVSSLHPDLVLWSNSCRRVYIIELTVPWEEAIDEAYERKRLQYSDLAAQAEERG